MKQLAKGFGFGMLMVAGLLAAAPTTNADQRVTDGPEGPVVPMQDPALQEPGNPEWGVASLAALTISAWTFTSRNDSPQSFSGYNRFSPTGQEVEAAVMAPSGALISSVELQGCDTSTTESVVWILYSIPSNGSPVILSVLGDTGTAATPGCGKFTIAVSPAVQVDNGTTYGVAVRGGTTSATSYTAVRVFYRLQVSPAPATATFSDVPTTHPFFQFIEALAASGVTGGCTLPPNPNYCPNDPLTRGQMAVFLARALGLHFTP